MPGKCAMDKSQLLLTLLLCRDKSVLLSHLLTGMTGIQRACKGHA